LITDHNRQKKIFHAASPEGHGYLAEQSISAGDESYLCQNCKELLGMLSLMGFGG